MLPRKLAIFLYFLAGMPLFSYAQVNPAIFAGYDTTRRVITTAVPFLVIAPDARSGAMGDAGVASTPDAASAHWNPGKYPFIKNDYGFSLSYTPWLGKIIDDMSISHASGYYKINRERTVGMSLTYFDLGKITFTDPQGNIIGDFNPREFALDATYAQMLTDAMGLGVSLRYINSNLTGHAWNSTNAAQTGRSVAADIGWYYNKDFVFSGNNSNVALGAAITNIGNKMTYSDSKNLQFIPTNMRIGGSFTSNLDPYNKLTLMVDLNKLMVPTPPIYKFDKNGEILYDNNGNPVISRGKNPNRSLLSGIFGSFADAPDGFKEEIQEVTVGTGLEYWYNDLFAARGGYFLENANKGNRKYFTLGLGLRYHVFGIDLAYLIPQIHNNPLAETLRFTLVMNFDTYKQQESIIQDENKDKEKEQLP